MPILVIAAICFALFVVMGVLATVAVLSETRGMPGSVWKYKRGRGLPIPNLPKAGRSGAPAQKQ